MFPDYWLAFVNKHRLVGKSARISEDDDLSSLGAEMQFLSEAQSIDELKCWPGQAVEKDGYVPVAWCSLGSGDYYYINSNDGPDGPLYRVYHDAVGPEGYDPEDAADKVLHDYPSLLRHVDC